MHPVREPDGGTGRDDEVGSVEWGQLNGVRVS